MQIFICLLRPLICPSAFRASPVEGAAGSDSGPLKLPGQPRRRTFTVVFVMALLCGVSLGNLRPLLNGESLKNWPNGEFEKRMSQIWSIFKQMFENRSIFKQMFENTVHFQTHFEKNNPPQGAAAPWGRRRRRRQGYFFKMCLKMDRIFKHLFENGPFSNICLKIDFQTRHWASFSKFHHLIGDASYQHTDTLHEPRPSAAASGRPALGLGPDLCVCICIHTFVAI